MKRYDVITIGGAMEDVFFEVDDFQMIENPKILAGKKLLGFEYGSKVGVPAMQSSFGGGANNAAIAFSRLGFRTAFMGVIGDDGRGEMMIKNLIQNEVSTRFLKIQKNMQTGVSFILVGPDNEHVAFTYRGANSMLKIELKDKKKLEECKWLFVTSLTHEWRSSLKNIFNINCHIAWNPGRVQLAEGCKTLAPFLKKTDIFICNHSEALTLTTSAKKVRDKLANLTTRPVARSIELIYQPTNSPAKSIEMLLKEIHSFGPKIVIITQGSKGAYAYDGKKITFQSCIKITKPLNTAGVGDAFGSSFVAGMELYKGNIKKALELAAKNAASVVLCHHGAQEGLLSLSQVNTKLKASVKRSFVKKK